VKFPDCAFHIGAKSLSDLRGKGFSQSTIVEERRKILQQYIQELALIPTIKESIQFKRFLGMDEHCPEYCELQTQKVISGLFSKQQQQQQYQQRSRERSPAQTSPFMSSSKKKDPRNRYSNISSSASKEFLANEIENIIKEEHNEENSTLLHACCDDDLDCSASDVQQLGTGRTSDLRSYDRRDGVENSSRRSMRKVTSSQAFFGGDKTNNLRQSVKDNCLACQKQKQTTEDVRQSQDLMSQGGQSTGSVGNYSLLDDLMKKANRKVNPKQRPGTSLNQPATSGRNTR